MCNYSMKKIIYILLIFSLQSSICNLYAQWVIQPSPVTSFLHDVEFINRTTGWACGDGGVIIKTTNGGINWFQQESGVSNKNLWGIHPVDSNTVYCVGWFQTILKTTNGGTNWQILRNGSFGNTPSFFEVFFLNENTGWLLRNNYILRTTNGGISFDSSYVVFSYLRDVYFKDTLNGIICGDGALILKTTDGGVSWSWIEIPRFGGSQPDFFNVSFINDTGWVVARTNNFSQNQLGHLVWRTTNFGSTWDTISRVYPDEPFNYENFCVSFSSNRIGWCGGTFGKIFKTTNGGFNWIQQQVPSINFRRSMWFFNDSIGWAVGGGGQIVHTTSGGQYLGIEPVSGIIPSKFTLKQNYPNPFNSQTNIEFELPESGSYTLEIYDILGRKLKVVFNEYKKAGIYRLNFEANDLAAGVYLYTLYSGKYKETRKFILVK